LWLNSYPEENEATKGFYDSNKQRALTSLILCYFYDCKKGGGIGQAGRECKGAITFSITAFSIITLDAECCSILSDIMLKIAFLLLC